MSAFRNNMGLSQSVLSQAPVRPVNTMRIAPPGVANTSTILQQPPAQPLPVNVVNQQPINAQPNYPPAPSAPGAGGAIQRFLNDFAAGGSGATYSPYDKTQSFMAALFNSTNAKAQQEAAKAQSAIDAEKTAYDRSVKEREMALKDAQEVRAMRRDNLLNRKTEYEIQKAKSEAAASVTSKTGIAPTFEERNKAFNEARTYLNQQKVKPPAKENGEEYTDQEYNNWMEDEAFRIMEKIMYDDVMRRKAGGGGGTGTGLSGGTGTGQPKTGDPNIIYDGDWEIQPAGKV